MNFAEETGVDLADNFSKGYGGVPAPQERTLNDYAAEVHKANAKWWICMKCDEDGEIKAIQRGGHEVWIICPYCNGTKNIRESRNVSEALEGSRKNLPDDKLPHRKMFEVELADCVIRVLDICGGFGLDLEGAYREKMAFNAVRMDHSLEHRMSEHGKKY